MSIKLDCFLFVTWLHIEYKYLQSVQEQYASSKDTTRMRPGSYGNGLWIFLQSVVETGPTAFSTTTIELHQPSIHSSVLELTNTI